MLGSKKKETKTRAIFVVEQEHPSKACHWPQRAGRSWRWRRFFLPQHEDHAPASASPTRRMLRAVCAGACVCGNASQYNKEFLLYDPAQLLLNLLCVSGPALRCLHKEHRVVILSSLTQRCTLAAQRAVHLAAAVQITSRHV